MTCFIFLCASFIFIFQVLVWSLQRNERWNTLRKLQWVLPMTWPTKRFPLLGKKDLDWVSELVFSPVVFIPPRICSMKSFATGLFFQSQRLGPPTAVSWMATWGRLQKKVNSQRLNFKMFGHTAGKKMPTGSIKNVFGLFKQKKKLLTHFKPVINSFPLQRYLLST